MKCKNLKKYFMSLSLLLSASCLLFSQENLETKNQKLKELVKTLQSERNEYRKLAEKYKALYEQTEKSLSNQNENSSQELDSQENLMENLQSLTNEQAKQTSKLMNYYSKKIILRDILYPIGLVVGIFASGFIGNIIGRELHER